MVSFRVNEFAAGGLPAGSPPAAIGFHSGGTIP